MSSGFRVVADEGSAFRLYGELDPATAPILSDVILAALDDQATVTLDLVGVTFMSSDGVRTIAQASKAMRERGGRLVIRGATGIVRRVLDLVDAADWPGVTMED